MSQLTDLFQGIADAIRGKTGETSTIAAADFATKIAEIPAGSGEVANMYISGESVYIENNYLYLGMTRWVGYNVGGYMQSAGKNNCAFIPILQTGYSTDVPFKSDTTFAAFYATNRGSDNAAGGGIFKGISESGLIRGGNIIRWNNEVLYIGHSGYDQAPFNISGTLIMW